MTTNTQRPLLHALESMLYSQDCCRPWNYAWVKQYQRFRAQKSCGFFQIGLWGIDKVIYCMDLVGSNDVCVVGCPSCLFPQVLISRFPDLGPSPVLVGKPPPPPHEKTENFRCAGSLFHFHPSAKACYDFVARHGFLHRGLRLPSDVDVKTHLGRKSIKSRRKQRFFSVTEVVSSLPSLQCSITVDRQRCLQLLPSLSVREADQVRLWVKVMVLVLVRSSTELHHRLKPVNETPFEASWLVNQLVPDEQTVFPSSICLYPSTSMAPFCSSQSAGSAEYGLPLGD
ncbi:uncharacterized protein BT62DRAFT_1011115 [Guyanagaster necrorhizus]|uniref:Uncharacterized protein n=1 Tax=Guyanagaster necrorhizus TaxID=856835 RepID=A0A9P8ANG4_9AGAR|nr:uncharacterized protein BT62DRAFT_1011115 [Guyanagaster necrorhizus MCA 3950]KAG7441814.1 hypothetical protein BT62DRAFT_1011115 [Guyanagaster necrorhizus MCA 3950]